MDDKIKVLLDKINMDESSYPYFSDAKLVKIKINSKKDSWQVFINKQTLLPVEVLEELEKKTKSLDENASSIDFIFTVEEQDLNKYLDFYPMLLKSLKKDLHVLEIYEDCLKIVEGSLVLVVGNETEKEKLVKCLNKINTFYKKLGYLKDIDIIIEHNDKLLEEMQKEMDMVEIPEEEKKKAKAP